MKNFLTTGLTLSALVAATMAALPVSATEFRMLNSWDSSYIGTVQIADRFVANVNEASGGETTISTLGPETVPPFEQLQPVVAGVFDMLFSHGAYHFGDTGVGNAMDAVTGNPGEIRESGLWELVDKHYQKRGLKLIALPPMGSGYHIMLKQPVGESGDLAGRRVRGTPLHLVLLERFGASPVVLPGGEIYSALERSVIDGAVWPAVGTLQFRWNEVADYFVRPTFGSVVHLIFMNLNKWNSLGEAEQQFLLAQGKRIEIETYESFIDIAAGEVAALEAAGMTETRLSDENSAKINKFWAEGVWTAAIERSGADAEALRQAALAAGLTE